MNREIKFRAWDNNKLHYSGFLISPNGIIHGVSRWDINDKAHTLDYESFKKEGIIIQQFTGFVDKNGVEIYEGDILNYCNYEVKYNEKFGGFEPFIWMVDREDSAYDHSNVEIIGNVFENPELLKENENRNG